MNGRSLMAQCVLSHALRQVDRDSAGRDQQSRPGCGGAKQEQYDKDDRGASYMQRRQPRITAGLRNNGAAVLGYPAVFPGDERLYARRVAKPG